MATLPISHFTWQVLRALVRAKNKPLSGKQLRVAPNRRTKDGTFFSELVEQGLLEAVGSQDQTEENRRWPAQYRTLYLLTERGKYAAEFGEYEREIVRPA